MSRAVLHAARGSRPAVPGRGATAPNCVRSTSCRAAGRRQRASSDAPPKPKSGFKLNASVAAPGSIGPRPAGRLAYARCRTGARASAGKTLARQAAFEVQVFRDGRELHRWVAGRFRLSTCVAQRVRTTCTGFDSVEAFEPGAAGEHSYLSRHRDAIHCAAATRELSAR